MHRADLPCSLALLLLAGLLVPADGFGPGAAGAQEVDTGELQREIQESRLRLEEVREERARLQREMADLRTRVQDVSGELRNIERQVSASRSVLAEIDFQVEATTARIEANAGDLFRTRQGLRERQAVLHRRLRSIYKRGPLHTVEVLLGADSFANLLNRYRYLHLVAIHDRSLVRTVRSLERELEGQMRELSESLAELDRLRQVQLGELVELREVEGEQQRTLEAFRSREEQTTSRITELEAAEGRLAGLVAELEERRTGVQRPADGAGDAPGTLAEGDRGALPWPVEGEIAYRFGLERRSGGVTLRWNGIGIQAPAGAPVRAVRGGTVALAGPFEGYGPTVILSHGDGFYTLYLHLDEVGVVQGRQVEGGQVVGTVGGAASRPDPYIEFQVRAPVAPGGIPRAQDPLEWLRPREEGS